MAKMPALRVAHGATFGVYALVGLMLAGPAPFAQASVSATGAAPIHLASSVDPGMDPEPLSPDVPGVQEPAKPGQTLTPSHHHRSHHRAPTST
ncbi:hypothetical protein GCM10009641_64080 [Mycobacterium cookii]|uniref:Uncharacterized protein n=1 Tax=Mycobacterium cookii TaxID=1775 RepID=A0A7I7KWY5_9MYCO|nr:hypothetical protein [Mycobacterium cookii]MCV7329933.1 hypothetical protein [Mycobacterium cookii]BBX45862.1 hypothetical protein MCOO_18770 [Mycobacterium cookii]